MHDDYLHTLQQGDEAGLREMYEAYCRTLSFRQQVGDADPALVFQTSALHLARLDRQGLLPAGLSPEAMFDTLNTTYRESWDESELTDGPLDDDYIGDGPNWLDADELQYTQQQITDWQSALSTDPAFVPDTPDDQADFDLWRQLQHITEAGAADLEPLHMAELQPAELPPVVEPTPRASRFWPRALAGFALLTCGYAVYQMATGQSNAGAIFDENFSTPKSLLADLNQRYPEGDTAGVRVNCGELLRMADESYQQERYDEAVGPLDVITMDTTAARCHADAYFYLGVIYLKLEKPGEALQSFAKIDNLDAYGDDLYWYQALAFVQIAHYRPDMRPVARRAVERAQGNTTDPERREQAEKMLQKLKD